MFGVKFSSSTSSLNWPPEFAASTVSPPNSCEPIERQSKVATLPVVQSTNLGYCNHSSQLRSLDRPRLRRVLLQGKMRPRLVIVGEIRRQGSTQGEFSEDDHMVQALAPNGTDQAFHV